MFAVYAENYAKHINKICEVNAEIYNVKHSKRCAFKF